MAYLAELPDPTTRLRTAAPKMKHPFVTACHVTKPLPKLTRHWHLKI